MSSDPQSETDAKRLVLDFLDLASVQREAGLAAERHLGESRTQHGPTAPDGAAVCPELIGGLVAQASKTSSHLERAFAEGDLVVLHHDLTLFHDDPAQAVVDNVRVEDWRTGTSSGRFPPSRPTATGCPDR